MTQADALTLACDELEAALRELFPTQPDAVKRVRDAYQSFGIILIERATAMSATGVIAFLDEQARQGGAIRALEARQERTV